MSHRAGSLKKDKGFPASWIDPTIQGLFTRRKELDQNNWAMFRMLEMHVSQQEKRSAKK